MENAHSKSSDLQKEILPQWQSALKWGQGEVEPGSTPSGHTGELPSPVLTGLTRSFHQVLTQRFRPCFNSSHTRISSANKREQGGAHPHPVFHRI